MGNAYTPAILGVHTHNYDDGLLHGDLKFGHRRRMSEYSLVLMRRVLAVSERTSATYKHMTDCKMHGDLGIGGEWVVQLGLHEGLYWLSPSLDAPAPLANQRMIDVLGVHTHDHDEGHRRKMHGNLCIMGEYSLVITRACTVCLRACAHQRHYAQTDDRRTWRTYP